MKNRGVLAAGVIIVLIIVVVYFVLFAAPAATTTTTIPSKSSTASTTVNGVTSNSTSTLSLSTTITSTNGLSTTTVYNFSQNFTTTIGSQENFSVMNATCGDKTTSFSFISNTSVSAPKLMIFTWVNQSNPQIVNLINTTLSGSFFSGHAYNETISNPAQSNQWYKVGEPLTYFAVVNEIDVCVGNYCGVSDC